MKITAKPAFICLFLAIFLFTPLFAQENASPLDYGLGLNIGAETIDGNTYQVLGLTPDLSFGNFGVGLNLALRYRFVPESDNSVEIYPEDWVPADFQDFFATYLPKIRYVRYGQDGDNLYAKLGSIDDATLGNGFIMGNYSNMNFLPEQRIFGMAFELDGNLFDFPYLGMESFVANFSIFDVLGGRVFTRPIAMLDIPVLSALQIGATMVADTNPYYHVDEVPSFATNEGMQTVAAVGGDFMLPILGNNILSLATFGDIVGVGNTMGGMLGFGGKLISLITYGAQLRILGENFIPNYFGPNYDLYRTNYIQIVNSTDTVYSEGMIGWFVSSGFSLLDEMLVLNISLDGPFNAATSAEAAESPSNYPHLLGSFTVAEGLLPGFSFEAMYDKKYIETFEDLFSPEDALIEARLNYQTGPAIISLVYNVQYNPNATGEEDPWEVTSGLETEISLF
ncbi:MAG: hypothetical protein ACLFR1_07250 [Spirochaetia bacterium]